MVGKPIKLSKRKLNCKIVNIEPDPKNPNRTIVAVQLDDGDAQGPWIQGFSILNEKTLTIDEFIKAMYERDLSRPIDPLRELKEWKKTGKQFVVNLSARIEVDPNG